RRFGVGLRIHAEAVGDHHGGVPGEVGESNVVTADIEVNLRHDLLHLLHDESADAIRADVLHRWDKLRLAKCLSPGIQPLADAATSEVIKGGARFDAENEPNLIDG